MIYVCMIYLNSPFKTLRMKSITYGYGYLKDDKYEVTYLSCMNIAPRTNMNIVTRISSKIDRYVVLL